MKNLEKKWENVQEVLKDNMEQVYFSTWIHPLKPLQYSKAKKTLYLTVHDELSKSNLEKRWIPLIEEKTAEVFNSDVSIILMLPEDAEKLKKTKNDKYIDRGDEKWLNPKYTFDTFIVGENNRFAQAAALAVSEAPGEAYNPLFIYGGAGLGKTHLMHAIGHFIREEYPSKNVLYVSSEMFTNDFINATRNHTTNDFKIKYRSVDVLLLDDIQFIAEKEKTREEVFHTYNTLYDMGKQIIFSSDRAPKDLLGEDERLVSRLSWGLIVDIQPPDFETKVAILKNKAILEDVELTDGLEEVINLISDKIKSNVREMEGAFTRVVAFSNLTGSKINKELAREVLHDVISIEDVMPTPESIKKHVSQHFDLKISDLESSKRARSYSFPRQIAMYLCREMTDKSYPQIGEYFGKRDHSTVFHACEKIEKEKATNDNLKDILKMLDGKIRNI